MGEIIYVDKFKTQITTAFKDFRFDTIAKLETQEIFIHMIKSKEEENSFSIWVLDPTKKDDYWRMKVERKDQLSVEIKFWELIDLVKLQGGIIVLG